jgi:hypothetical protein
MHMQHRKPVVMLVESLPPSVRADPRFASQLDEARRLRDRLPPHTAAETALAAAGLLDEARLVGWDGRLGAIRAALGSALGVRGPLETLHEELPGFSPERSSHAHVMQEKRRLLKPLADEAASADFRAAFDALVCTAVAPHIARAMPAAETIWYATMPTLRVQTPSDEVATIRPHVDGMYDLPPGSVNFWVPLTEVSPASALWVESSPGVEDFHPLTQPTVFNGRSCMHFTIPNRSSRTRVSLDFRCVPGPLFDPAARLSRLGYFAAAARGNGPDSPFKKTTRGRISMLHGLPHSKRALELMQ